MNNWTDPLRNTDNRKSKIYTVYRYYEAVENNKNIIVFEVWTDFKIEKYYIFGTLNLIESKFYRTVDVIGYKFGEAPFIEFRNNNRFPNNLYKAAIQSMLTGWMLIYVK